jgi:methylenetetrahydrofolate dehydrogenase (NADP+) / methenyltetrahydrofolate cyclohydrolase
MDGRALAAKVRARVAEEVRPLGRLGLATILVGDDPASQVYIRHKHAAAEEVGIAPIDLRLPVDVTQADVLDEVRRLNADDEVDGILVQTPLPEQLDEAELQTAVDPVKDVDGLHPLNAGLLYLGRPAHVPATPRGVMELLAEHGVRLEGARAVVIGRSAIVGKPVAALLQQANATVTVCHSHTQELGRHTLAADVVVAAVGVPGLVAPDLVKGGAAVVDVGITRTEAGLVGDVDPGAADVAAFLTPVPGGVGPMTIACLLENTVQAARYRRGDLVFPGGSVIFRALY